MVLNKDVLLDYKIGFVTKPVSCLYTGFSRELQANDSKNTSKLLLTYCLLVVVIMLVNSFV